MINISPPPVPELNNRNSNLPSTPNSNLVDSEISNDTCDTVPSSVNDMLINQVDSPKDLPNFDGYNLNSSISNRTLDLTEANLNNHNTPNFHNFQFKNNLDYFSIDPSLTKIQNSESKPNTSLENTHDSQVTLKGIDLQPQNPINSNDPFTPVKSKESVVADLESRPNSSKIPINNFRRHTTPNVPQMKEIISKNQKTQLQSPATFTRNSFDGIRSNSHRNNQLLARSTFPNQIRLTESENEQTNRARYSFLSKRKKKKWFDDDHVVIGNKISEGHQNFVMAYNMLTGIRVAVSRCSGVMKKITDEDYKTTKKLQFNMDGSDLTPSSKYDFKFKDYCPEVFRDLRNLFGLDPADYLVSITGKYILSELGSPGKSGSFFYYSRDYRFIIKTIHHAEHKQLRRILKDYHEHVKENPNTLISQFYGLHRVKMPFKNGSKKVHFIVMNNLFPPHRDIHFKYDLKGSTWGRKTKYGKDTDLSHLTLKDLNWLERHDSIKFGPAKKKLFIQQLESDVKLLKKINVMDYSLLLGIHDVKRGNTDDLKLSVFDPKSSNKFELIKTNPRDLDRENDLPNQVFPGRTKFIFYGHDGGIRATDENNEPLSQIYYLGIIDCLTNYGCKKKMETLWRSFSHPRETISAIPASEYGDRFLRFIKEGIKQVKSKVE